MSQSATTLIKLAARQGLLAADVARQLVDKVRNAAEPQRLAEHLLVQGGHCSQEQVQRLRADIAAQGATGAAQPTMIGGFRLLDRLGGGGMGEVYRAQQVSMQRTVALKLLNRELLQDDALGQRFLREARAAGAINHPNVVSCFDVGVAEGRYFMALELVAGGDAERLMRAYDHRLGERRALEIARDCARGLEALHDAGFVHRDIKPSNILLTEDGAAKIGDLGLVASTTPDRRLTQSGTAMGTPAYMSPEQADGTPLDARTDLYSLGASLFYLLTGHPPYTGQSAWAVVAKVINDPFPDPRRLNPQVSVECARVVLKATAKDRAERYASARELRVALDGLLASTVPDHPSATSSSSISERRATMTKFDLPTTRGQRPWLIPVLITIAVVVIVAQSLVLWSRPVPVAAPGTTVATPAVAVAPPVVVTPPPVAPTAPPVQPTVPVTAPVAATPPAKPANWLQQPAAAPVVAAAQPATPAPTVAVPAAASAPAASAPATPVAAPVVEPAKPPVVAVLGCEAGDLSLRDFSKAFPELLAVALTRKGAFDLVERTQLRQVLSEQELTQSGVIDSSNAARIGKLVGARVLITQRVYSAGEYTYVSAKAIDVESGRVKAVSKGDLKKNATPALMAAHLAIELGKAVDALSGATPAAGDEVAALIKRLSDAVRGKRLPTLVIAVEESHVRVPAPDPAVRTELGYLLRKSGFRVIESDSPALAAWTKEYAAGRTAPFPADLGAVEVVIAGSGISESVGAIGALTSARARLELSAIAVRDGQVLAVERATTSAADASEILAGKTALEQAVRKIAVGFVTDMTTAWSAR